MKKKDRHYMDVARCVASASKCLRARFGAVIVSVDDRIIATGRNGKPRGSTCDHVCFREGLPPNAPGPNCCTHAEANAILFSAPLERQGATLYVTGHPCSDCTLLILQSGVARLVYLAVGDGSHPGWTGEDVFARYGKRIAVARYTDEAWERRFGDATPLASEEEPSAIERVEREIEAAEAVLDRVRAARDRYFTSEPW